MYKSEIPTDATTALTGRHTQCSERSIQKQHSKCIIPVKRFAKMAKSFAVLPICGYRYIMCFGSRIAMIKQAEDPLVDKAIYVPRYGHGSVVAQATDVTCARRR